jgi:hypothetical protein
LTSPDGKGVILIGGWEVPDGPQNQTATLYRLNCEDFFGCNWQEMEQKLKVGRRNFVAMIIPDSLTNCTKTILNKT